MDPLAELKQTFFQECEELLGALADQRAGHHLRDDRCRIDRDVHDLGEEGALALEVVVHQSGIDARPAGDRTK